MSAQAQAQAQSPSDAQTSGFATSANASNTPAAGSTTDTNATSMSSNPPATDATPPVASSQAGDFVSREAYDALKQMMDKKSAEVDAARHEVNAARNIMERTRAANEHYVRQNVGDIQNVFKETLQTCNEQEGAFLLPWNSWAENLAKTPAEQLDSEMGLAVFAAKASANVKRGREAEETLEKTKNELQHSHKRVDELEAQLVKSQRATSDMQALAMERSTAMEDLSKRYQKLVGGVNRYDFSLLASREAPKSDAARRAEETITNGGGDKSAAENQQTASGVPATMATGGAGAPDSSAPEHAGLAATTAVASMGGMGGMGGMADGKAVAQDRFKTTPSQLADFISTLGRGTDRYVPSPFGLGSSSMPSQSEAGSSSAKTDIAAVRAFLSMHA